MPNLMIETCIFPKMSPFAGLTQFCIRYRKTCQATYPALFFDFFT
jgi:hypothetical protein